MKRYLTSRRCCFTKICKNSCLLFLESMSLPIGAIAGGSVASMVIVVVVAVVVFIVLRGMKGNKGKLYYIWSLTRLLHSVSQCDSRNPVFTCLKIKQLTKLHLHFLCKFTTKFKGSIE